MQPFLKIFKYIFFLIVFLLLLNTCRVCERKTERRIILKSILLTIFYELYSIKLYK